MIRLTHALENELAMSSPRMRLDLGKQRGYFAFTLRELRVLILLATTAITTGVGYVIRCEVKFVTLETQLKQCHDALKPSPTATASER